MERGFAATDDVVTVKVVYPPIDIGDHQSERGAELLHYIATASISRYVYAMRHQPVLLGLCPEHAATLAEDGFSQDEIRGHLWAARALPGVRVRPAGVGSRLGEAERGFSRYPLWRRTRCCRSWREPEDIQIIVVRRRGQALALLAGPKGMVSRLIDAWR